MPSHSVLLPGWLMIATLSGGVLAQQYQYGDYPLRPIQFSAGRSSAVITDSVERGASATYSFAARAGQKADVASPLSRTMPSSRSYLPGARIKKGESGLAVEGESLPGADAKTGVSKWSGVVPEDGRYIITVTPTRGAADYKFTVAIK
jgi:hypothetical protein